MNKPVSPAAVIRGEEHWTNKGSDVRLFLWNKHAGDPSGPAGRILFVHGSSMASQPTFDLQVPGRPSPMDYFAAQGYDTWCVDMEGYGRSTKDRDHNSPISYGADDCFAAASYIEKLRGKKPLLVYGISSGALRAALFAQRHPEMVARLACDAMVWTGEGSPTLAERSQEAAGVPGEKSPADRPQIRALDLRARSSRHCRRHRDRGVRGCDPQARRIRYRTAPTSTCARTCRSAIPRRSRCRP